MGSFGQWAGLIYVWAKYYLLGMPTQLTCYLLPMHALLKVVLKNPGQKARAIFRTIQFVQVSPARGPNFKQIMYEETSDFQCQH